MVYQTVDKCVKLMNLDNKCLWFDNRSLNIDNAYLKLVFLQHIHGRYIFKGKNKYAFMTSFSNNQLVLFLLYINPTSALISVISSSSTAQMKLNNNLYYSEELYYYYTILCQCYCHKS